MCIAMKGMLQAGKVIALTAEKLLDDPQYAEYFTNVLADNISFLGKELPKTLDSYYKKIEPSVSMDYVRWDRDSYYDSFDSTKSRLENLALKNGLNAYDIDKLDMRDEQMHTVSFIYDGEVQTINVTDGEQLTAEDLPVLDTEIYDSWKQEKKDDMLLSCFKPIYEDMVFIPDTAD